MPLDHSRKRKKSKDRMMNSLRNRNKLVFLCFALMFSLFGNPHGTPYAATQSKAQSLNPISDIYLPVAFNAEKSSSSTTRTVNAAYFSDNQYSFQGSSIFWFGQVTSSENYADVRVGYTDTTLSISLSIMDRYLWYDLSPSDSDLDNWDAVSVYISTKDRPGIQPGASETKWVGQLNHWQPREDYQTVFRGTGSNWGSTSLPFTTLSIWRGEGPNDNRHPEGEDKGWLIIFHIPFSSLGISTPQHGTPFRLAIALHDRDSSEGSTVPDKVWPETANDSDPSTWGKLHLGLPTFQAPQGQPDEASVIRNGSNGAIVKDAHVGGAFDCGASVGYDWNRWGNTNYELENSSQVNIQSQRDIADWPCFSKYFISFPLNVVPANAILISASLTMFHFGNSYPAEALASNIHVLGVDEDWVDTTITWNNAPLARVNYSNLRVEPLLAYPGWPGIPVTWDVSLAVQDALANGGDLMLALYSSDNPMHSGKYFFSSDSGGLDLSARPYLTVNWKYP